MQTKLILIRHGATAANLASPALLQGRNSDVPLAPLGVRQAELTRDFLAIRDIDVCYSSPMLRAMQTARIICEPHELEPQPVDKLIECNVGDWEGKSWQQIRAESPDEYQRYMKNPARFGYPGGENFAEVFDRVSRTFDELLLQHAGQTVLIVAHHVVNRTYLASLIGLPPSQARRVSLENCSISVVVCADSKPIVHTLNSSFHLQAVAA